MRHELHIEGHAFRLRPIADRDAAFVVELRTNPRLNRYLHAGATQVDEQLTWLGRYYEREGDYYFVVERLDSGASEGLISIYDIDATALSGYWGRWVLKPNSLASVESVYLMFRMAFEQLRLRCVYSRTVGENEKVVSFHDSYSCGKAERRLLPKHFQLGGRSLDGIEHRVSRASWGDMSPQLDELAKKIAERITRG